MFHLLSAREGSVFCTAFFVLKAKAGLRVKKSSSACSSCRRFSSCFFASGLKTALLGLGRATGGGVCEASLWRAGPVDLYAATVGVSDSKAVCTGDAETDARTPAERDANAVLEVEPAEVPLSYEGCRAVLEAGPPAAVKLATEDARDPALLGAPRAVDVLES